MVARFSIGRSSYQDLRGVEQFVATERMALQLLSVKVDFDQMKADQGSGDRLSFNEGMRSRARQTYLWNNRAALGVVVARPFTSRHDEVNHGNAVDVGVTRADGSNRALTSVEFAWLHTQIERRGGTWTGRNFGEPWHHEMATRPEQVPPYPNARALVAAGPRTKSTTPTPPPTPAAPTLEETEDMRTIYVFCIMDGTKYQNACFAIDTTTGKWRHIDEIEERATARSRGLSMKDWRAKYAEGINGPQVEARLRATGSTF